MTAGDKAQIAQTIDRPDRETTILSRLTQLNREAILDVANQALATHGLACLGAAHTENMPPGRRAPKVVIEAYVALHVGMGNIERVGDKRNRCFIDIAEFILEGAQVRQESTGKMLQFSNPEESPIRLP
jgi:hypothetical protein